MIAFDVLGNVERRREYDSVRDVDDDIPTPDVKMTDDEFYSEYGKYFKQYARFSNIKPVPTLGDASTPMQLVHEFYDFWFNQYTSWRTFASMAEHDVNVRDHATLITE